MLNLAPYDLDFQPETYWPEGFEPFAPEEDPPPVHRLDKGGEVYRDGDDIRFRYVMLEDAAFQARPPFLKPGMLTSPEPLTCGDIMYLLDFTMIGQSDDSPGRWG